MLVFILLAIPFFLILGIIISLSTRQKSNNFLYLPVLSGILPMLGTIYLFFIFEKEDKLSALAPYFLYGPACITAFWLSLSLLGLENKKKYQYFFTFFCIFLFVPLALYPLISAEWFENN